MVVKICKPVDSSCISTRYSEKKVDAEKATVIFSSRIHNPLCPEKTFQLYEKGSKRCESLSFHASVNPAMEDNMTEAKIIAMIKDLMFGLGYGGQPYIVYKHEDIERAHYHIVSVRVNEKGEKINDSFEYRRCKTILKALSKKYGYTVGKKQQNAEKKAKDTATKEETAKEDSLQYENNNDTRTWAEVFKGFDPKLGNVKAQLKYIADYAMSFGFNSEQQFRLLMRSFNVDVRFGIKSKKDHLILTGIDPKSGLKSVSPIYFKDDTISASIIQRHASIMSQFNDGAGVERVNDTVKTFLPYSMSETHLMRMLAKYGISVQFVKSDEGKIIDAMFIDHDTKTCIGMEQITSVKIETINNISQTQWMLDIPDGNIRPALSETHTEYTEMAIQAIGAEQSRRHEDEEIMNRARKKRR